MKKRYFLVMVLATATMVADAQTPKADSLLEVLKRDTMNYDVLMRLLAEFEDLDNRKGLMIAKQLKAVALRQGDTAKIVMATRLVGQLHNRLTNVRLAIEELASVLPIAERHALREDVKRILNSLATSFSSIGEYDKSLDYNFKSLTLKQQDQDYKGISVSLNNIGLVYFKIKNFDRALQYWKKCLDVKESIGDKYDLDVIYLNLALCYHELKKYNESKSYFDKVFKTCSPNCRSWIVIHAENAIGELLLSEEKIDEALSHFKNSLLLSETDDNLEYRLENLIDLSRIAIIRNDMPSLKMLLDRLESIDGKEQFPTTLRSYYKFSGDYYHKAGLFKLANQFERKYSQLTDILNDAEMHRKLMELQIRFIERENASKLEDQDKLLTAQKQAIDNQKLINRLLIGISLLAIVLLLILFQLNIRKSKINRILDQLVKERTFELESKQNALVHSYNEQQLVVGKISKNLKSTLATITGLASVARLEDGKSTEYFQLAEDTLNKLIDSVDRIDPEALRKSAFSKTER